MQECGLPRTSLAPKSYIARKILSSRFAFWLRSGSSSSIFQHVIPLSARDSAQLINDIESPPQPNSELRKSLAIYKEILGVKS